MEKTIDKPLTEEDRIEVLNGLKGSVPVVQVKLSTLGGKDTASLSVIVSLDPRENWNNEIYENSRYSMFSIDSNGKIEQFKKSYKIPLNFRKTSYKTIQEAIAKIKKYLEVAIQYT